MPGRTDPLGPVVVTPQQQTLNFAPLTIASLADMRAHEAEILRRMAALPLGGNLFIANPLRLLTELNVLLAPGVGEQYLAAFGEGTSALSEAYDALKKTRSTQKLTIRMAGLFAGGTQ